MDDVIPSKDMMKGKRSIDFDVTKQVISNIRHCHAGGRDKHDCRYVTIKIENKRNNLVHFHSREAHSKKPQLVFNWDPYIDRVTASHDAYVVKAEPDKTHGHKATLD